MKPLNEHLEEQLNEGIMSTIGVGALIAAGIFCTGNGLYAIYQLVKNKGTKGAYDELIKSLDIDNKANAKALSSIDLNKLPNCKALVNAINSNKPFEDVQKLYTLAKQEIMQCGKYDETHREISKRIKKIADNTDTTVWAKQERKIKWLINPIEFFTGILKNPFGTRFASLTGAIRGFGGGSTFGGGAGSKW